MPDADIFSPRPTLTNPSLLARALEAIGKGTTSQPEVFRRLTERFAVDLDAVAALMPRSEAEPFWLKARDRAA